MESKLHSIRETATVDHIIDSVIEAKKKKEDHIFCPHWRSLKVQFIALR